MCMCTIIVCVCAQYLYNINTIASHAALIAALSERFYNQVLVLGVHLREAIGALLKATQ